MPPGMGAAQRAPRLKGYATDVVSFSTSEGYTPVDFPANFKLLVTPTSSRRVPILIAMYR
jgi:hypothetical protein